MDKHYDHTLFEPQAQQLWEKHTTFAAENNPGPLFSIDTPPPTVSGSLHIGHIFSYTQTDIIARHKRMSGYSVFYPFGFDDNGLPTERFVEKKLDIQAHAVGRSEFIKLCLKETKDIGQQFKKLWQRMGLSADWNKLYSTISERSQKISQESFIELYRKGHVYRKYEPALYCTTCRTSVAQAELDDIDQPSFFNTIVFKDNVGRDLLIGTTRPELLSSCVALLFNPKDERYQHLRGTTVTTPIFEHTVPVFEDDLVEIEKGTGLVMVCTFGDKTDIVWYKKFNLPYKQSIGLDGKWMPDTGILAGLRTKAARETIIAALKEQNLLIEQKAITHSVNVHERCKKEIEYVALYQWFLRILDHKEKFLQLADEINWYPAFMKSRYINWVENLNWDWCLSRQRFYGIPFPIWYCQDCQEILLPDVEDLPIDPQEKAFPGKVCTACSGSNIIPDTDVMDTWNTSSITPQIVYSYFNEKSVSPFRDEAVKDFIPMGMRPQAHDIIRTWAFYTIIKSWFHHQSIPWHNIVISGHVLSDAKEKISKSKENGNILAPENLLSRYPADAIRYWTASGNLGHDVAFSENQLKIGIKLLTKLWNAFRFVGEHIKEVKNPSQAPADLGLLNTWMLLELETCFEKYTNYFEKNEFGLALSTVEQCFWNSFCDNYLELVKDQLFKPENYSAQEVAATRWTLHNVGLRLLQLYAPYTPHITEVLYGMFYQAECKKTSIAQTQFATLQKLPAPIANAEAINAAMQTILQAINQIRKLKSDNQLSLKTELATLTVHSANSDAMAVIKQHEALIKGIAQAHTVVYEQQEHAQSIEQQGEIFVAHICLN